MKPERDDGSPPDDVNDHGGNDRGRAHCAYVPLVDFEQRPHGRGSLKGAFDSCTPIETTLDLRRLMRRKCAVALSGAIYFRPGGNDIPNSFRSPRNRFRGILPLSSRRAIGQPSRSLMSGCARNQSTMSFSRTTRPASMLGCTLAV
jgi:hypothetical protein